MRRLFGQQKEKTPVPTLSQTVEKCAGPLVLSLTPSP